MRTIRSALLCTVALTLGACFRVGYDSPPGSLSFGPGDQVAFGGAVGTDVALAPDHATLTTQPGFAATLLHLEARYSSGVAVGGGGLVYFAGGLDGAFPGDDLSSTCGSHITSYDLAGGSSTLVATLPTKSRGGSIYLHPNGKLYTAQGYCSTTNADELGIYTYPPGAAPLHVADFPTGGFDVAYGLIQDAAGNSRLIAAGGYGSGPQHSVIVSFDPATTTAVQHSATLPTPRNLLAGASVGKTFFTFGGNVVDAAGPTVPGTSANLTDEIVAITLGPPSTAAVVGHLPEPLMGSCAVTRDDGSILVVGGARYAAGGAALEPVDTVYSFDPTTSALTTLAPLPMPVAGAACANDGAGHLVVLGGVTTGLAQTDQILVMQPFSAKGELLSTSIDSGRPGALWSSLTMLADLPAGTAVQISARASDAAFLDDTTGWQDLSPGAIAAGTLQGRFLQWHAILSTTNPVAAPALRLLTFSFSGD